jgi:hypothetical protein
MTNDAVRDFLREKGCAYQVVERGLPGLVESWEKVVQAVDEGYSLTLDDYLNDMDVRQLINDAINVASASELEKFEERLQQADDQMKSLTRRGQTCLWGDELAEEEGWTPKKNWWYYARPIKADPDLLAEIDEVAGNE